VTPVSLLQQSCPQGDLAQHRWNTLSIARFILGIAPNPEDITPRIYRNITRKYSSFSRFHFPLLSATFKNLEVLLEQ